jgi:acyl-CoA synthetase (AMP-forming)/AMP-acid ligase II
MRLRNRIATMGRRMHPSLFAVSHPSKPAIVMASTGEIVTFRDLDERANRCAHMLRDFALRTGDHIAFLLENRPAFFEVFWAAQRAGLYVTPISTRLTAGEIEYILIDSGAKLFITSAAMTETVAKLSLPPTLRCLMLDDVMPGFESYERIVARHPGTPTDDPAGGVSMLYSSGTTGQPKGVKRALPGAPFTTPTPYYNLTQRLYGFGPDTIYLSPAPLYHAAPLTFTASVLSWGGTVVVMEKFDAEQALLLIEREHVTHSQWVPTMFVRLLRLPDAVKCKYDLSTHRVAVHAAAPCSVEIKRQMIEWWGPIIREYYAGSEGNGFVVIDSHEWLSHPGSVGRAILGELRILGEDGKQLPPGDAGGIYFANGPQFEYHNDPAKTRGAYNTEGWSTLGDVGYIDEAGYLYLTDRRAYMIISGGVNIYPQEAENVLTAHPRIVDVAVFGVPNEEFGEEVKAVVQPVDMALATPAFAAELIAYCRERLADVKCPRSIDFDPELPRHPNGKLYKRILRDRYWQNRVSKII